MWGVVRLASYPKSGNAWLRAFLHLPPEPEWLSCAIRSSSFDEFSAQEAAGSFEEQPPSATSACCRQSWSGDLARCPEQGPNQAHRPSQR